MIDCKQPAVSFAVKRICQDSGWAAPCTYPMILARLLTIGDSHEAPDCDLVQMERRSEQRPESPIVRLESFGISTMYARCGLYLQASSRQLRSR